MSIVNIYNVYLGNTHIILLESNYDYKEDIEYMNI